MTLKAGGVVSSGPGAAPRTFHTAATLKALDLDARAELAVSLVAKLQTAHKSTAAYKTRVGARWTKASVTLLGQVETYWRKQAKLSVLKFSKAGSLVTRLKKWQKSFMGRVADTMIATALTRAKHDEGNAAEEPGPDGLGSDPGNNKEKKKRQALATAALAGFFRRHRQNIGRCLPYTGMERRRQKWAQSRRTPSELIWQC